MEGKFSDRNEVAVVYEVVYKCTKLKLRYLTFPCENLFTFL